MGHFTYSFSVDPHVSYLFLYNVPLQHYHHPRVIVLYPLVFLLFFCIHIIFSVYFLLSHMSTPICSHLLFIFFFHPFFKFSPMLLSLFLSSSPLSPLPRSSPPIRCVQSSPSLPRRSSLLAPPPPHHPQPLSSVAAGDTATPLLRGASALPRPAPPNPQRRLATCAGRHAPSARLRSSRSRPSSSPPASSVWPKAVPVPPVAPRAVGARSSPSRYTCRTCHRCWTRMATWPSRTCQS